MSPDPWTVLRAATRARIGLGRAGDAPRLAHVLDFQLAHARARDAVHATLDTEALVRAIAPRPSATVRSQAVDRPMFLRRPDLGRLLDPGCHLAPDGEPDAVFVLADGLSAVAAARHGPPMLAAVLARLSGWSIAPIILATQARVALADEIGARLKARMSVILIGERPGLSAPDSLGIYVTWAPAPGRRDSERNCISNIHADGLPYEAAADMLTWLMTEARARKLTGVGLKDDRPLAGTEPPPALPPPAV